ncbi:hypothetical protein [Methanoregula formicica]|uniref:Uncharacterized protein n=1 Tax=Methanoregula formicica (strain DSM 22288 / NBRC 105244 / SMSP) TaxID=593750 RepID=L0HJ21_METFS|nr:hypothetical protein [Methanoregula formicica]AGB03303.1 hypothetical protein Metfor_2299 [Methanoregula formicica SMSP]
MESPDPFRYGLAALVLLTAIALTVFPASAHAPSDIQLSYNDAAKELTVVITHPVPDPQSHYIRNVKVKVNDVVSVDRDYTSQPSGDRVTYTCSLPLNKGDTIRVTATCSQGPSLTKVMDIAAPAATTASAAAPPQSPAPRPASTPAPAPVTTQKSALGLLPVIAAAAFVLAKKR